MKKSVRITNANREALWNESDLRYELEAVTIHPGKSRPSTGAHQKERERDIRDMLNVEGITYSGDLRARGANRGDITTRDRDGKPLVIEVKHGGGALAYASYCGVTRFESRDRELCLTDVDWVVYNVTADITDRHEMACEYRVSSRKDFLDMLEEYCHGKRSKGWDTATKYNNPDRTAINIQSQYIEEFWAGLCEDERAMTLWDFCEDVLGRSPRWHR